MELYENLIFSTQFRGMHMNHEFDTMGMIKSNPSLIIDKI